MYGKVRTPAVDFSENYSETSLIVTLLKSMYLIINLNMVL